MSLNPGTRLGSYEIVSVLGVGGMGEVYRARDARLQHDCFAGWNIDRLHHSEQRRPGVVARRVQPSRVQLAADDWFGAIRVGGHVDSR